MAGGSDSELTVDKVSRDHCDGFYTCEVSKNKQLCFKVHHCLKSISKVTMLCKLCIHYLNAYLTLPKDYRTGRKFRGGFNFAFFVGG